MTPLTSVEINKLDGLMVDSEREMKRLYVNISGGFAVAKLVDFDEDSLEVELKSGVQSDCTNNVHTDTIHINRKTMTIVN
jgi:hypothetical protein